MKTCPKCRTILFPKKSKKGTIWYCRKCDKNYSFEVDILIKNKVKKETEEPILVTKKDVEKNLPKTKVVCPKCGNEEAYYYMQQTRSADEPPTVFYICTKCGYSWRSFE